MSRHHFITVNGVRIFYREGGLPDAPVILLLHGFPSSSRMFRDRFTPRLGRYRVVAPDDPGFGHSDFPKRSQFEYTFASYTALVDQFTQAIGLKHYSLYIQDYGASVGLRLALLHPERIGALVIQNGKAYDGGFSSEWDPLKAYWKDRSSESREQLRNWLNADGIRSQ